MSRLKKLRQVEAGGYGRLRADWRDSDIRGVAGGYKVFAVVDASGTYSKMAQRNRARLVETAKLFGGSPARRDCRRCAPVRGPMIGRTPFLLTQTRATPPGLLEKRLSLPERVIRNRLLDHARSTSVIN